MTQPAALPLAQYRLAYALSVQELAERAGVAYRTIRHIEAGNPPERMDVARKIATALKVTPHQIKEFEPLVGSIEDMIAVIATANSDRMDQAMREYAAGMWLDGSDIDEGLP